MNISNIVKLIMSLFTYHTGQLEKNSGKQPSKIVEDVVVIVPGIKESDGYYYWNKGQEFNLGPYFKTAEFDCQCKHDSCVEQKISIELVKKLQDVRVELARPVKVTSGFRCSKHQADLRSSGVNTVVARVSTHELGNAADIRPVDRNMTGFLEIVEKSFLSIGLAKTFLHVDLREDKERRWNY